MAASAALARGRGDYSGGLVFQLMLHPDFEALLATHPEDRTTYLVYSDWLEEHGQDRHAELLRSLASGHCYPVRPWLTKKRQSKMFVWWCDPPSGKENKLFKEFIAPGLPRQVFNCLKAAKHHAARRIDNVAVSEARYWTRESALRDLHQARRKLFGSKEKP